MTGFGPPAAVGETCALFRLRRKQKPRNEIIANVTKPTALPIPAFSAFESPVFFLGLELESSYVIAVAVGLAGDVPGSMIEEVALKDE